MDYHYNKPPRLTQEDLQLLFDCVLFSTSTDVGWNNSLSSQSKLFEIIKKFAAVGWKGSDMLYLFNGNERYEDELISDYIERVNILRTKG
tara:strand:- start:2941 stop:3210 length:270 start_codon:yes stop_codon:yes gene_type:complete